MRLLCLPCLPCLQQWRANRCNMAFNIIKLHSCACAYICICVYYWSAVCALIVCVIYRHCAVAHNQVIFQIESHFVLIPTTTKSWRFFFIIFNIFHATSRQRCKAIFDLVNFFLRNCSLACCLFGAHACHIICLPLA